MLHRANFADRLAQRILETRNPTVLGLDPLLDYIPAGILDYFRRECDDAALASGLAIYEFNRRLIDSVADIVPAIKPQSAYYEQYGVAGITALRQTIQYAGKCGMLVIADCKRNDIGSTAAAYAKAYLDETELNKVTYLPACAEACPTKAIAFGNLMDADSEVAKLSKDPRAFRILEKLKTEPKVYYLSKHEWVRKQGDKALSA